MTNDSLKQIEHAAEYHDMERFYRLIRQLGVEMKRRMNRGKEQFAPNQGKDHFVK